MPWDAGWKPTTIARLRRFANSSPRTTTGSIGSSSASWRVQRSSTGAVPGDREPSTGLRARVNYFSGRAEPVRVGVGEERAKDASDVASDHAPRHGGCCGTSVAGESPGPRPRGDELQNATGPDLLLVRSQRRSPADMV